MKQSVARACRDLATTLEHPIFVPISPSPADQPPHISHETLELQPPPAPTVKVTLRELRALAKPTPSATPTGSPHAAHEQLEEDSSRRERASAVLALRKAATDVQVITSVVGLTSLFLLPWLVYTAVFVAESWLITKPWVYYETAAFGPIWIVVVVSPASLMILCRNEWRYRHAGSQAGMRRASGASSASGVTAGEKHEEEDSFA